MAVMLRKVMLWLHTGIVEALATMEVIMDHIAAFLDKDPLEVRELNLADAGALRPGFTPVVKNVFKEDILPLLKVTADFENRKLGVTAFNEVCYFSLYISPSLSLSLMSHLGAPTRDGHNRNGPLMFYVTFMPHYSSHSFLPLNTFSLFFHVEGSSKQIMLFM